MVLMVRGLGLGLGIGVLRFGKLGCVLAPLKQGFCCRILSKKY